MDSLQQTSVLVAPTGRIEREYLASGVGVICGVDEAGRGPLAGPVVAAAVIYRDCEVLGRCTDSKLLSPRQREALFPDILEQLEVGIGKCSPSEIDRWNIRQASLKAMVRAVKKLESVPDLILVDGRDTLPSSIRSIAIVKGDRRVATIAAASIIAKVTRDRLMISYDRKYPVYGFARHFGYPTLEHRTFLREHGPCPIHRGSFRGVRELVEPTE